MINIKFERVVEVLDWMRGQVIVRKVPHSDFNACEFEIFHDNNRGNYPSDTHYCSYRFANRVGLTLIEDTGYYVEDTDDYVFSEYHDAYFTEAQQEDEDSDDYHERSHCQKDVSDGETIKCGIEFEYAVYSVIRGYSNREIFDFSGIRIEQDCSIGDEGREIITAICGLSTFNTYLSKYAHILFNGHEIDDRCGGHFNLSHSEMKPKQFVYSFFGSKWLALLGALYPERLRNSYCPFGVPEYDKYSAFHLCGSYKGDRFEIRIFPGCDNLATAQWRTDLINAMISGDEYQVFELVFKDSRSDFWLLESDDQSDFFVTWAALEKELLSDYRWGK